MARRLVMPTVLCHGSVIIAATNLLGNEVRISYTFKPDVVYLRWREKTETYDDFIRRVTRFGETGKL